MLQFKKAQTLCSHKQRRSRFCLLPYQRPIRSFGIAQYFHEILINGLKESPYFSVSFDESLNGSFQNCQNDFISYWSQKKCKLRRYILDFKLLSHQAAKNMNILIISLRKHIRNISVKWMAKLLGGVFL